MACRGELPKFDHAIFADIGWEPKAVYKWLEFLIEQGKEHGIPIHVVRQGDLRSHVLEAAQTGKRVSSPPFFTRGPDGSIGMINRSCTTNFKIIPIKRKVKELLGLSKTAHWPKTVKVEQWLGISADEMGRMKQSQDKWCRFWHPLIEDEWGDEEWPAFREQTMTRFDCLNWMKDHGYPEPPRSACIGCPFHSNYEWRQIRNDPEAWADACDFDDNIRGFANDIKLSTLERPVYVHRSGVALRDADIDNEVEGQTNMFDQECHGMCGL